MSFVSIAQPEAIANTRGQRLSSHCLLVGMVARELLKRTYPGLAYADGAGNIGGPDNTKLLKLSKVALACGICHDIGKLWPAFQAYLGRAERSLAEVALEDGVHMSDEDAPERTPSATPVAASKQEGFTFERNPRHEEVSWMMMRLLMDSTQLPKLLFGEPRTLDELRSSFGALLYGVFWHHAKALRSKEARERFSDSAGIQRALSPSSLTWLRQGLARKELLGLFERMSADAGADAEAQAALKALVESVFPEGECDESRVDCPAFKASYADKQEFEKLTASDGDDDSAASGWLDIKLRAERDRSMVRSCVVGADRIVSALSAESVEHWLDLFRSTGRLPMPELNEQAPLVYAQIERMIEDFTAEFPGERTQQQATAAVRLAAVTGSGSSRPRVACLQGPAGCGKTKIALQYLLEVSRMDAAEARRVFVFVPRTAIGLSLFDELRGEYGVNADVELLTGRDKLLHSAGSKASEQTPEHLEGKGAIVVATIDQVCRTLLSHHSIDLMSQLAQSHVIFDEAHELLDIPGIALLFLELMKIRMASPGATLLISATPNPQMMSLLGVNEGSYVRVATFNDRPLSLRMREWMADVYKNKAPHPYTLPTADLQPGAFLVCNTATLAQRAAMSHALGSGAIPGRDVVCFHSKYTPRDKRQLFERVLGLFGKVPRQEGQVLISGPIVQASLNVSTAQLLTEASTAENVLQRIGRVNRFGLLPQSSVEVGFAPNTGNRQPDALALVNVGQLNHFAQGARTEAFTGFLLQKTRGEKVTTLAELYEWYEEFHKLESTKQAYASDLDRVLEASRKTFSDCDFDPVQVPQFMHAKTKKGGRLSRNSLRGRSYFVLPLKVSASPGCRAEVGLLWHPLSPDNELLTDELRSTGYSGAPREKFMDWSAAIGKPGLFPLSLFAAIPVAALPGLKSISSAAKRAGKLWPRMLSTALRRETPIVVSTKGFDEEALYYFELKQGAANSLNLGLMSGKELRRVGQFDIIQALS